VDSELTNKLFSEGVPFKRLGLGLGFWI